VDGHHAGSRLASPLHYSSWLNYGFIELAYLIGGSAPSPTAPRWPS